MHIVGHGLAPLVSLVSLHESARKRVILLKLIVASSLVVTEATGDGEVFGACIKDDAGWLGNGRTHVHCSQVDCVVSAIKGYLKLQVILIILRRIRHLTNKLRRMHMDLAALLALLFGLDEVVGLQVVVGLLCQTRDLLLPHLPVRLTPLHFSQLTVVQFVALDHYLFVGQWNIWAFDNKIDVGLLGEL